tara:strand:- start:201 stop:458 length:258 start_codon:yes stop_codon:yes gene_type:complete
MTINIKNIINIVAKKITEADSADDYNLLSGCLNISQRQGLGQVREYNNTSPVSVPYEFTDSDRSRLIYAGNSLYLRKNAGWQKEI